MKKKLYIIFIIITYVTNSFALTRGDVQIIEATENIQYLGEKISTNYFLLYKKPNNFILQNKFRENIKQLEKNIEDISKTTKNKKTTKFILQFYVLSLEDIKELILETPNHADAQLMLDASKAFLEGARGIANEHQYESSKEEEMLVRCKELIYLIESVSKYYMAFQIGLKDKEHDKSLSDVIQKINKDLKYISKYPYSQVEHRKLNQIKNIWSHNQYFFINREEATFPNLLLASNEYIQELLINLEKHHKENL
ncbi:MAG: Nitric oxide-responding transcriptional regulator Dnr (Crp/Fnr family) [uncultured Sulfurovum sp.]|uniref:Nitric oxide-responding transcriptional regulator Dnr (Crp/Fnr family) n=1 Tax=uncultured Sulfurovum sp. TaxID=269237 RepID=A0A6S6T067_9BACT|nr:MAG: Nitric oxide-responding transcriptional regulator Dnr (Crp/Fnr family) [uncultured Sulfurovum sp.]